ncbi:MAG TPA: carotenoid oxygenase family protein [Acidimicrobiales bacterium]|nr:carotenoid oxygenase family protein [Acidimicrobiales bacterium]
MDPPLPIEGILPPDLQGTLLRIGPGEGGAGALNAVELRDGTAVSLVTCDSAADANVFWHAGSVLALAEVGLPLQYSRQLVEEEFGGGLTVPIASHVHRDAATGHRVLFGVEEGAETNRLRLGEWDAQGALASFQAVTLERATWQHDLAVTARHIVFVESPTEPLPGDDAVPFRWTPGAECWAGVVPRGGEGTTVRWFRLEPCLVTHVLGASDDGDDGDIVLYVCAYQVPEKGQPVDLTSSIVGPDGIGMTLIGGGLPVLERWRISGGRLERTQVDERFVEYPRVDPHCEGLPFRYGYCVELDRGPLDQQGIDHLGLLRFDVQRDEVTSWNPGQYRTASEPLFVRAVDGRSDDEGWLLTVVDDATRGASDIYVLDASSFGRRGPQAVIHLPNAVPFRSHGEWVGADRYR